MLRREISVRENVSFATVIAGMMLMKPKITIGIKSLNSNDLKSANGRIMGELN